MVWFLDEFIQKNSYNCLLFLYKFVQFYTNCIVRIHTKCDFYFFLSLCKQVVSAQREPQGQSPSCEHAARAAWAKPVLRARSVQCAPRARSASCEGEARAASAQREPRGRSPSTPPAPTRSHPAAPTIRVHPAAPTIRVHPAAPTN
jgi:hypothetical protein